MSAIGFTQAVNNYGLFVNLSASGLIKTGPGVLNAVVINSHTAGTLKIYDNTAASGTVMFNTITLAVGERSINFLGAKFGTGCYVTIGGAADVTFIYN